MDPEKWELRYQYQGSINLSEIKVNIWYEMFTINSQMPPLSQTDYRAIAVNTFQLNLRELYKVQSGALTVVPLEMRNCLSRMDYTTYHQKVRGKPSKMKLKTFIFYPFLETRNQGHFNYSWSYFLIMKISESSNFWWILWKNCYWQRKSGKSCYLITIITTSSISDTCLRARKEIAILYSFSLGLEVEKLNADLTEDDLRGGGERHSEYMAHFNPSSWMVFLIPCNTFHIPTTFLYED